MKAFGGKVLFLDRSDINTDEIIPAKYLTEISKEALKPHMLEDLKLEGFNPQDPAVLASKVLVTRANFGCGSSREHAPWVFEVNDINVVIASSFARIFRQNMFNCGMAAIELPKQALDSLFAYQDCSDATIDIDVSGQALVIRGGGREESFTFDIAPFDKALLTAGGWVDYADRKY